MAAPAPVFYSKSGFHDYGNRLYAALTKAVETKQHTWIDTGNVRRTGRSVLLGIWLADFVKTTPEGTMIIVASYNRFGNGATRGHLSHYYKEVQSVHHSNGVSALFYTGNRVVVFVKSWRPDELRSWPSKPYVIFDDPVPADSKSEFEAVMTKWKPVCCVYFHRIFSHEQSASDYMEKPDGFQVVDLREKKEQPTPETTTPKSST